MRVRLSDTVLLAVPTSSSGDLSLPNQIHIKYCARRICLICRNSRDDEEAWGSNVTQQIERHMLHVCSSYRSELP